MHAAFLLLLFWILPWFPALPSDYDDFDLVDRHELRSRILMIEGHIFIQAGAKKNISFHTSEGGYITVGNTDISNLPPVALVQTIKTQMDEMRSAMSNMQEKYIALNSKGLYSFKLITGMMEQVFNQSDRLESIEQWRAKEEAMDARMRKALNRVAKNLKLFTILLQTNFCELKKPCQSGGICIPRFGPKYTCLCPAHKTGANCEVDVDECDVYQGTPAGCQNNATCTNTNGSFICACKSGFHGPLCQYEMSTCSRTIELCGDHGHCIEIDNPNVKAKYKCICDWGYRSSGNPENPTCLDVDECLNNPCHPGVDCINTPGSFQCAGCPLGYIGNGQRCADIDECAADNYPCSENPKVECYNTIGSYHCGACPPGHKLEGKNCKKISPCAGRSPCYPDAKCKDDETSLNAGGFTCICPSGMMGNGIGPTGCAWSSSNVCASNKCMNGATCVMMSEMAYGCDCADGYFGKVCENILTCHRNNPCQNDGICMNDVEEIIDNKSGYKCGCQRGFYGNLCENEEISCNMHVAEVEGNLTFSKDTFTGSTCNIALSPNLNGVSTLQHLEISFTNFSEFGMIGGGKTNCSATFGNVSLYNGVTDMMKPVHVFCGDVNGPKAPYINQWIRMALREALVRVERTSDKGQFTMKWRVVKTPGCGGLYSNPKGFIQLPIENDNMYCRWFLSSPANKRILLAISSINMKSGSTIDCEKNQIQVYDGYAEYDTRRVWDVCVSTNETTTITSTGPFLSFSYKVMEANKNLVPAFSASYEHITPDHTCGGDLINDKADWNFAGIIESPNWGGFYPSDADCTWKLNGMGTTGITDQRLKLEFISFDVPSQYVSQYHNVVLTWDEDDGTNVFERNPMREPPRIENPRSHYSSFRRRLLSGAKCTNDYLHVYSDGKLVFDACNGHKPPFTLMLPVPQAIIQFHSDEHGQGRGFQIQYSMVCEKTYTGNGTIQTWNYPSGGRAGNCRYVIEAQSTQAITVKFKTIGLRVATQQQCWFKNEDKEKHLDYVKFSGGLESNKDVNQKYICARYPFQEDTTITVSGFRPFVIEYASTGHEKNTGLLMEYTTTNIGCGGFFNGVSSKILSSPNFPEKYPSNMHCVYHIQVYWSKQIRLTFDNFEMEVVHNDDCSYDYVSVYEYYNTETNKGRLLGKFCGTMLPPSLLSSSSKMAVVFNSDKSVSGTGFSARFEIVDGSSTCDRTYTEPSGRIIFNGAAATLTQCDFHIATPHNTRVMLRINKMTMPCRKAKLMIRNGASETSPEFPSLGGNSEVCDEYPTPLMRSHGNRIFMTLKSTEMPKIKFNISYEQITAGCGGVVRGMDGSVAAPQYPLKDSRSMDCSWTVAVALGNRVRLSVVALDDLKASDEAGFCNLFAMNRLDIFDGPQQDSRLLKRFCKQEVGIEPISSDDHELAIKYKQQGGIQFGSLFGFLAHFTTVCQDITLTDFTGSIQSPGYPDKVYSTRFCTWTIRVPEGNRIELTFHDFVIQQKAVYTAYRWKKDTCIENWLKFDPREVAEVGTSANNNEVKSNITESCDDQSPLRYLKSTGNVLHISFQSRGVDVNKFWLTYATIGCVGEFLRPAQIQVNRTNLDRNTVNYECQWRIQAPVGKRIQFNITTFSFFRHGTGPCTYGKDDFEGIAIYNGRSNSSGYPMEIECENAINRTIKSHTNEMFIRMKVPAVQIIPDSGGIFFTAAFGFVDADTTDKDDCGGIVEVDTITPKIVTSPRFPLEYPVATECEWLFKTKPGYSVSYNLKEFITPNSHEQRTPLNFKKWRSEENLTCSDPMPTIEGALTFYAGPQLRSTKIDRICLDITEPKTIYSGVNTSLVTFQGATTPRKHMSGESEEDKKVGFILEARAVCGGDIIVEDGDEQMVTIPDPKAVCNLTIKRGEGGDGVHVRLYEFRSMRNPYKSKRPPETVRITVDGGESVQVEGAYAPYRSAQMEFFGEQQIQIDIEPTPEHIKQNLQIYYSNDVSSCGGEIIGHGGFLRAPPMTKSYECVWTLKNTRGSKVAIFLAAVSLPPSDNCTESYLEVRRFNESGELLGRHCELANDGPQTFHGEGLYIKLRFITPPVIDADYEDVVVAPKVIPKVVIWYSRTPGGTTPSKVIEAPEDYLKPSNEEIAWTITGEPDQGLLIHFEEMRIPPRPEDYTKLTDYGLKFQEVKKADVISYSGYTVPEDLYLPYSNLLITFTAPIRSYFRINWESVPLRDSNYTEIEAEKKQKKYDCGSHLTPTWEWQQIESPILEGTNGYPPNYHCRWTMDREQLTGLQVKFIKLDLEQTPGCRYDYLSILTDYNPTDENDETLENSFKICHKTQENQTFDYNHNKQTSIHFVSDRSRGGTGFIMQYRKTCSAYEYIRAGSAPFSAVITNPGYDMEKPQKEMCSWSVVFESNRRAQIEILDMDISKNGELCDDAFIVTSRTYQARLSSDGYIAVCGTMDALKAENKTIIHASLGRIFIKYLASGNRKNKIKFRLSEIVESCGSEHLVLDDHDSSKTFMTTNYPGMLPNSLDCTYMIRAGVGHRIKFTVDPNKFRFESHEENCDCEDCDYIELRDGPDRHSPLIGRYCNVNPPSSIFSTDNFLYLRIHTDSFAASNGFKAQYEIASCGGTVMLRPDVPQYINSPNYPDPAPTSECLWTVYAPNSNYIEATIQNMQLSWRPNCTQDRFEMRNGNETGEYVIPPTCNTRYGSDIPIEYRTHGSRATVIFKGNDTGRTMTTRQFCKDKKCGFQVELRVSEQGCGGIITKDTGYLTTPGYPNRLLTDVECTWELQAGITFRYVVELEFTDGDGFYVPAMGPFSNPPHGSCFEDLRVQQGRIVDNTSPYAPSSAFCTNRSSFISDADYLTLKYSDIATREYGKYNSLPVDAEKLYRPFRIKYTRVAGNVDDSGCGHHITTNSSIQIGYNMDFSDFDNYAGKPESHYCHVKITKPPGYNTIYVMIHNYSSPAPSYMARRCGDFSSKIIVDSNDDQLDIEETICNSTFMNSKSLARIYLSTEVDFNILFFNNFHSPGDTQKFIMSVSFEACGGTIREPNQGSVTSPYFGGGRTYPPYSNCAWLLEAPEDQIVQIDIEFMEVEYEIECNHDWLLVGEGYDNNHIHRYCHNTTANPTDPLSALDDRFKTIRSNSRHMVLMWNSDESKEYKGWKINYQFITPGTECGFTTHAMTGVIQTKNWPKSYENNEECLWDIQVPQGYHVLLHFDSFDIESSEQCANDAVTVSEEHSARGISPLQDYFFYFEDEEKKAPLCGVNVPPDVRSESNRIRVNFTSNEAITAAGFKATWTAECGTVFRLRNGLVSSPHYPNYYPNEDRTCEYVIYPQAEYPMAIMIRLMDIDLSDSYTVYGRQPCGSDYVEIIDIDNDRRVVKTYCGDTPLDKQPIAIMNAVGIRFVTNDSYILAEDKFKAHRGFQFTYSTSSCGGEVKLTETMSQVISSPAFPLEYAHDLNCVWNITGPSDRILAIKYEKLDIEEISGCELDYLEVFNPVTNSSLGRYCGDTNNLPSKEITINHNNIHVIFHSDSSMSKGGFKLIVTATLGPKAGCGGLLKATSELTTLVPPLDDNGNYLPNLLCGWDIVGPENTILELSITELNTEFLHKLPGDQDGPKCVDAITIWDGYKSFSPIITQDLCGTNGPVLPAVYHTSHKNAHFYFESDNSGSGKGFVLKYRTIKKDCGAWLTATDTEQKLNYEVKTSTPGQKIQRCQWVIRSKSNVPIELSFSFLNFHSATDDCSDAFVEVRDVGLISQCNHPACATDQKDKRTFRFCDNVQPPVIISNTMALQITTSGIMEDEQETTFEIKYKLLQSCNRTVNATLYKSGQLSSPNFPKPYDHNSSCTTQIFTKKSPILIVFRKFDMELGRMRYLQRNVSRRGDRTRIVVIRTRGPCQFDYLQLLEAERNTSKYCAAQIPPTYFSETNSVNIFLKTDADESGQGYDLSYYTIKTRSEKEIQFNTITSMAGVVTNIGWPFGYNASSVTRWLITPPSAHTCTFVIHIVDIAITMGDMCLAQNEFVQLEINTGDENDPEGGNTIGRLRKCSMTAENKNTFDLEPNNERYVSVIFQSDDTAANDGTGFRISWTCDNHNGGYNTD